MCFKLSYFHSWLKAGFFSWLHPELFHSQLKRYIFGICSLVPVCFKVPAAKTAGHKALKPWILKGARKEIQRSLVVEQHHHLGQLQC